jgi:hypothetical protein
MSRSFSFSLLFLAVLPACGGDDEPTELDTTDSFDTTEMLFSCDAKGNGEAVVMTAFVLSPESASLALGEGDRLLLSADDAAKEDLVSYQAGRYAVLLPTEGRRVTLSFARGAKTESAAVELPPPFAVIAPEEPITPLDPIALSWEPADEGDTMSLLASGPCIAPVTRPLTSDTGVYELVPGDLAFDTSVGGCTIGVTLTRTRPAFDIRLGSGESGCVASQVRTAAVEIRP